MLVALVLSRRLCIEHYFSFHKWLKDKGDIEFLRWLLELIMVVVL
jgi:hypothetical protein